MTLRSKKRRGDPHFGGLNRRMMAATIDSCMLAFFAPIFNRIAPLRVEALASLQDIQNHTPSGSRMLADIVTNGDFMASWAINLSVQMLAFCVFSGICWHYWSATPGKMIMRLKLVDAVSEQPVSDKQILIRLAGYWLSCFVFLLGVFWIGIDKKKRGWHDRLAGTVVITLPWRKKKKAASV